MRISLDGYGSKIRKVSRCRPTVSTETILATKQEFFYKSSPRTKHNWHCTIGFLFNTDLQNVYFILHYLSFFVKIFFLNIYISVNIIFKCTYLSFGWEIGHPCNHPKCVHVLTGGEGYHASCDVRTYTIPFHVFVLWCLVLFVEI